MGIFDKLFGTRKPVQVKDLSEHRHYLDSLREPAIRIEKGDESGLSKIGGLPIGSMSLRWPEWNGRPLSFLCQIDFAAIPRSEFTAQLPRDGIAYFFYDPEQRTWGFDPDDRGSWKVLYHAGTDERVPVSPPAGLGDESVYKEKHITFAEILMYPDAQDERIDGLNLDDAQMDEFYELRGAVFRDQPAHQLLGYPTPVQGNDMDLESQLVSNGLYCGDATGYNDPRAKSLAPGRHAWILLLQLDSDDDTDMMWGDAGMLYFWIRRQDLENKHFSNVWMILQCS